MDYKLVMDQLQLALERTVGVLKNSGTKDNAGEVAKGAAEIANTMIRLDSHCKGIVDAKNGANKPIKLPANKKRGRKPKQNKPFAETVD